MSSLIFPSLPGVKMGVKRRPLHATKVQTAASGREMRATWQSAPRYRYSLAFEFLRSTAAYKEFQRLANFLVRHVGQFDSFLFSDPEDNTVADHGFGVGNGTTTAYQLQRTLGVTVQDVLGSWLQYTTPRTNLMLRSQTVGAWDKTTGGTGSLPVVTSDYGMAPDGTVTADLVQLRLNGGTTSADHSTVGSGTPPVIGKQYTWSVWLKTADGSTKLVLIEPASGRALGAVTVTGTWQRFSFPWTCDTASGSGMVRLRGGWYGNADSADLLVWGAQYEEGVLATRYIPTTSAAVRQDPEYWPETGDGYEPVYDPAPGLLLYLTDWQDVRQLYPYPRTNLILRSEEFDNASWTKNSATVAPNAAVAPDGAASGDSLVEAAATAEHYASQAFTAADNSRAVVSVWLKAGARTSARVGIKNKPNNAWPSARVNLTTGATSNITSGATATTIAYPNNWWRVIVSGDVGSGGGSCEARVWISDGSSENYAGNGTSGIYVFGLQVEIPAFGASASPPVFTPYIKTTTATVTVTDYSLAANGVVNLGVAPIAGAALTWTGSYYRRVRVASDEIESERVVSQIWETKTLELISVKPTS